MAFLSQFNAKNPDKEMPVFYNVSATVGAPPAQNLPEDVLLVQYLLRISVENQGTAFPPDLAPKLKAVPLNGICDPATVEGIRSWQETVRRITGTTTKIVDGRVSSALNYQYGGGTYTIVRLNANVRKKFRNVWPRLDKIAPPPCPGQLQTMVTRAVVGAPIG